METHLRAMGAQGASVVQSIDRTAAWAVVAAVAGLWGAVEVTLGGFLHTIRMPMVGLVMGAGQVAYLAATRRLARRTAWAAAHGGSCRGFVAAVSVVAAGVKAMVPAGALVSPAAAIVVQGLLMELAYLVLPEMLASVAGGALAMMWSLIQTVVSQVVLFGWTVFDVYDGLFHAVDGVVGGGASGWMVVAVLVLFASVGPLAGWWGTRLGRRVLERGMAQDHVAQDGDAELDWSDPGEQERCVPNDTTGDGRRLDGVVFDGSVTGPNGDAAGGESAKQERPDRVQSDHDKPGGDAGTWRGWAVAVVCALAIGLAMTGRAALAGVGLGAAILVALWYDPSVLRRFAHLRLWLVLGVFAALGGFFLSRSSDVGSRWQVGGTVALAMMGRAVTFLLVAVLAARHLSMDWMARAARRLGLSRWSMARRLGTAVVEAWVLVPEAIFRIRQADREVRADLDVTADDKMAAHEDRAAVSDENTVRDGQGRGARARQTRLRVGRSRWFASCQGCPVAERAAVQLLEWAVGAGTQGKRNPRNKESLS